MKILPDEIPSDAQPLTDEPIPASLSAGAGILSLEGRNVFVNMKDGKSHIGLLHGNSAGGNVTFMIGNYPYRLFVSDVESYREA